MKPNKKDIVVASKSSFFNYFLQLFILLNYVCLTYLYICSYFETNIIIKINYMKGCFLGSVVFLLFIIITPIYNRFIITKKELIIILNSIIQKTIYIPCSTITGHALGSKYQLKLGEIHILTIKQGDLFLKYNFFELSNTTINKLSQIKFLQIADNSNEKKEIIYKYGISVKGTFIILHYLMVMFFVVYFIYIKRNA